MRGTGITSGRRPVRPDGTYYRQTRRRSVAGAGRGWGAVRRRGWWVVTITGVAAALLIAWIVR